ncbi:MAG: acyl-CoA dehydrogenase family protein [Myxococcales bacterium]|nr:acyl-CoA dehydrogenase family protein [Myxococcales bacterium]
MDFEFSPEVEAFREEVRAFFREEMAPERVARHSDPRDLTGFDEAFERGLVGRAGERGYLGVGAPVEYGGSGLSPAFQAVFGFEAAYHDAPCVDTAMTLAGAPMLAFGSPAQKQHWLPRMIGGELFFCIGYTEAEAGSDLSRIAMRARCDGDAYRLDGTKTLVTGAHKADAMLLIARSDPDTSVRRGSSLFVVDLCVAGIAIERRPTMNGWTLCDVHFEDVRVPSDALLGEENRGWQQMAAALVAERSQLFHVGWATRDLDDLTAWCRAPDPAGRRLADDPNVRRTLARLRVEVGTALRFAKRVVHLQASGSELGAEPAIAKLYATELLQRIAAEGMRILGPAGGLVRGSRRAPLDGRMAWASIERIHPTISVGSSEVQRTAIAQQGLGMPRGH